MKCAKFFIALTFLLLGIFFSPIIPVSKAVQNNLPAEKASIVLRGRVYCLDQSGHRVNTNQDCQPSGSIFELDASNGKIYCFSSTDQLLTMFTESRVRKLDLQISGILHDNNSLELIKIQALRDNQTFDIYYFCEVCNITAYGPGPCPCCYEPFDFIEKPAREKSAGL